MLRNYPFTILSPEVTNLQAEEARRKDNWRWLRRHVVVPQPPGGLALEDSHLRGGAAALVLLFRHPDQYPERS